MDFFNSPIHTWYSFYKRDLPWRNTRNPYYIWLSEIILQQTRIEQGIAYYIRFIEEFPEISDLADASEDQILKMWQGLGYYSRARNLHFTSKIIQQNYGGKFPAKYEVIRSLKGIGDYTAAAIASIAFNLEYPAVDGNVYRLLSRFFGISDPIDSSKGKRTFNDLAKELIKGTDSGMHNQAIMEFGALQCVPRNPNCLQCPLKDGCYAFNAKKVNELPVKQNKTIQRDRFFSYLVLVNNKNTWLRKRVENDIWKNLFEFPLIETSTQVETKEILAHPDFLDKINSSEVVIENVTKWGKHILSHQRIHYRFIRIKIANEIFESPDLIKVNKEDIFNFAVPKLLETYLYENEHDGLFI